MELEIVAVVAVIVLIAVSLLGSRIGVAAPLLLVVLGIGAGYLPFVPLIEIEPEIILLGVLPPLLYAAAVNVPLIDFRRNFHPVVGLSVLLVIISAVIIGVVLHLVVPSIPIPVGVALGAVISPTDAVAATSIGKRLGMPDRVIAILEGESLVNDATALVLLKTAIAAVSGSFMFWNSVGTFGLSVVVACAVGLVVGIATVWVRSKLRNPVHDTMMSFVVPFIAFIPAEELGASGVLAVVVTGLYTGHHASKQFTANARTNERMNWRTVQFVLENGVFLVMGLQLHALVDEVHASNVSIDHIWRLAALMTAILIVSRGVFMAPLFLTMRGIQRRYKRRSAGFTRAAELGRAAEVPDLKKIERDELLAKRYQADLEHEQDQALSWRDGAVITWSGMRGVVTLAAAQSIPVEVPFRAQLVLIAFGVAIMTLLLHGLTLPLVIRKLWPNGSGAGASSAELSALSHDLLDAANDAITDVVEASEKRSKADAPPVSPAVVERVRQSSKQALASMTYRAPATGVIAKVGTESPAQAYLRLARIALQAQRAALLEERAIGRYSSGALTQAELALDAHEARLAPPKGH